MIKKIFSYFVLCCFILFVLSVFGCTQQSVKKIKISQNSSLNESWAVITSGYINFYEQAGSTTTSVAHGRKGDIYQVQGKKFVRKATEEKSIKTEIWYKFECGWAEESDFYICSNRYQAKKISQETKN